MAEEKLLTVREVSSLLGISEREVLDLAENGAIPAYKVAGVYLRFRRDQVIEFKRNTPKHHAKAEGAKNNPIQDRVNDFFYFNDFYILSAIVIILLLVIIFQG